MFIDLETKRLALKCIGYDDADFFYKEFSTDAVNAYLYDADPCTSIEEAKAWISFYVKEEPRNQNRWIMILKNTGEKIGTCGFHCWDRQEHTVEIGYDLQPEFWRNGYSYEALQEIIKYASQQMKVKKIYAHISVDNIASINLVLKLGFTKTQADYYEEFRNKKFLHNVYLLETKKLFDL